MISFVDEAGEPCDPPASLPGSKADELPEDDRAMALGDDPSGGFAVPYQLDGKKPRKPRRTR